MWNITLVRLADLPTSGYGHSESRKWMIGVHA